MTVFSGSGSSAAVSSLFINGHHRSKCLAKAQSCNSLYCSIEEILQENVWEGNYTTENSTTEHLKKMDRERHNERGGFMGSPLNINSKRIKTPIEINIDVKLPEHVRKNERKQCIEQHNVLQCIEGAL